MDIGNNSIPNLQIENIGDKRKPHYVIKGFIELPCWNGYYLYDDSYKLIKNKVVKDGYIQLWVDGNIDPDNSLQFSREQINAYRHLVEHQENVKKSILKGLRQEFPRLLSGEYSSWDQDDLNFPKPSELNQEFDFKDFIGPESISIGEDVKDGEAYIAWHFRCRWDVEHGLDIITHRDKVIDIATEHDPWKIYKDNDTYESKLKEYKDSMPVATPRKQKKWWQFW